MCIDGSRCLTALLALTVALLILSASGPAYAQSDYRELQRAADRFLDEYVQDGLVDYRAVSENAGAVDRIETQIGDLRLEDLSESDQKAFLINAYNLLVIGAVAEAYPIESPLEVTGFFDGERYRVAGASRTLDGLEADIFERFPDPRIHFALVCAAESCPPLPDSTFRGPVLDRQLDAITRQAIRSDTFVRIDSSAGTIHLSRIFDWYRSDFERESGSLRAFVDRYRERSLPDSYAIRFTEYDWSLNEFSPASETSKSAVRPPDEGPNVQCRTSSIPGGRE